jgi:hypothetical protein
LFLGMDGNFVLERKDVSNEKADPTLTNGAAYMVGSNGLRSYLSDYSYKQGAKVSPLSNSANTPF